MTWQDWGSIGEIVGAIAVVITLIYLAKQIKQNTLVDVYRCYELWSLAVRCAELPGDTLEVGTWRGGTGALLAAAIAARKKVRTAGERPPI